MAVTIRIPTALWNFTDPQGEVKVAASTQEQISLAVERLKEPQESQSINSDDYGPLKNAVGSQRTRRDLSACTGRKE